MKDSRRSGLRTIFLPTLTILIAVAFAAVAVAEDRDDGNDDDEREVYAIVLFSDTNPLGQHRIHMDVRTEPLCLGEAGNVPCVENRRWHSGGVTYVTLNIQGSCNNLCDTAPDPSEWAARNAANIAWLHETFLVAVQRYSAAIMVISQANPGWHPFENDASPRNPVTLVQLDAKPDGFRAFLLALRA